MLDENKIKPMYILFVGLIVYVLTHLLIGFIPVGGGAGWDGSVYLDYTAKIAAGHDVVGDPYRFIRVSGFVPAILAARFGVEGVGLIKFQFL